jgi:hypothetical protein
MASALYRLGRFTFRHRIAVLGFWVGVLALAGALSAAFARPASTAFNIPGTESQQAIDLLNQKFPEVAGAQAQVVFAAPPGDSLTEPAMQAAVQATLQRVESAGQVIAVTDPYTTGTISQNGKIAFAQAVYKVPVANITNQSKAALQASAAPAHAAGITVAYAGGVIAPPGSQSSEEIGIVIAYVVLAVTFGSLLAAGLPLLTAIVGVAIGVLSINALGAVIDLSSTAPILATMIGLAVGIDYALFILHRYRENLAEGLDRPERLDDKLGALQDEPGLRQAAQVVPLANPHDVLKLGPDIARQAGVLVDAAFRYDAIARARRVVLECKPPKAGPWIEVVAPDQPHGVVWHDENVYGTHGPPAEPWAQGGSPLHYAMAQGIRLRCVTADVLDAEPFESPGYVVGPVRL